MDCLDLNEFQKKLSTHFRPWQRSIQFWLRATDIYTGYKVFQLRVSFEKDVRKQEAMWERQHEFAADKLFHMCSDLGGFFLKVAQVIGKPDLAPAAWVRRLVTLCDQAPATPLDVIQAVLENELGQCVDELFERFDADPIGSASIAQIGFEFDFKREADAMERIKRFMLENNKKAPVMVPRVMRDMVTRRVLVMEYIDGIPILKLGDEIDKRGINPRGMIATAAKQNILKSLTLAYGQMILKSGFFHADPHPGNILICKGSEVALLDYGQVKDLPDNLRLGYANLVLAIADNDSLRVSKSYRELGIDTLSKCDDEQKEMLKLAQTMFDTKLPPGVTMLQPFSDESSIKKFSVPVFPEELFSILRTVHILRGLSVGLGINYSCAEQWRPIAEEALYLAGRLKGEDLKTKRRRRGLFRRVFGRVVAL
ncbi:probable protein kinase UbiB isoform X5 [Camellia sinensis]|uniref:probable protein kinase UbiB isoform X5 n=1 Tax=Camellia sinensis TaxID=4442 RepID=UPI001036A9A4|nr:probable protein kinase UbiB isoform X5 [Camellia sinensis]